jgi:hypothetical protein
MKFLLIGNQVGQAANHRAQKDFLERTKEWVNAKLADGTLESAYSFPAGGGLFIANADSHESLMKIIVDFPLRPLADFEVHAISDFNQSTDIVIESIKDLV